MLVRKFAVIALCLLATNAEARTHHYHHYRHHHHAKHGGRRISGGEGGVMATYYGPGFHGHRTASGEIFNAFGLTAAHRSLPFGTIIQVLNPLTGRQCQVRINDRGPFRSGYSLDLSQGAARLLGFTSGLLHMRILR